MRAALARFLTLPLTQRSAVVLKDVLGHSLEETAETMGTTVMAVKAALVRGRKSLLDEARDELPPTTRMLDTISNATRRSSMRAIGTASARSSPTTAGSISWPSRSGAERRSGSTLATTRSSRFTSGWFGSRGSSRSPHTFGNAETASYFILLAFEGGKVTSIRDYRYVPYIALEADIERAGSSDSIP